MLRRAADRIADRRIDRVIEIRTLRTERIIGRQIEPGAGLPPAMLADDHPRIELVVETRPRPHAAGRCLDRNPAARRDAARRRGFWMQLDLGILRALAQARQATMLALAEHRWLRASENQRIARHEIGPTHGTDLRLDEVGKCRIAMIEKGFRP